MTLIWALIFFVSPAHAQYDFSIGLGARSFSYAESLQAPLKSTQSGVIPEFRANIEALYLNRALYLADRFDYAAGNLQYDGSTQPPDVVPVTENDTHSMFVDDAVIGVNFGAVGSLSSSAYDWILYTGLSYRTWNRNLSDPAEVYTLLSIPVGFRFMPKTRTAFSAGIDIAWKPLVYGNVQVNFSPSTGYDTLNAPVNNTTSNLRAEVPIYVFTYNTATFFVMPWYEQSDISQGPLKALTQGGKQVTQNGQALGALEPSSHTVQYGADIMMDLTF